MNDNVLRLDNVSKEFSGRKLFSNFTYDFKVGCIYVLQGYSGCGKTTLLSIIANFTRPTNGNISFNDEIDYERHVSYLPAENAVFMNLSVNENLKMVSRDNDKIKEILSRVGLEGKEEELGRDLSKGEMVRLAIARIILEDRFIMLFDEPTGNLDAENTAIIFKLLKELCREHIVIISSHDQINIDDRSIIFEYDNGKFLYEEKEREDIVIDKELKTDKIKNKRIYKRFIIDIFLKCIKQTIFVFIVITGLSFFFNYFFSSIYSDANTYIYKELKNANIIGTVTSEKIESDYYSASAVAVFFNGVERFSMYNDNNLFKALGNEFLLEDNSIIVPKSVSEEMNIKENDKVSIVVNKKETEVVVKQVYEIESHIESLSFYSLLSEDNIEDIKKYNTPIFVSKNLIDSEAKEYYYYCSTDLFETDNVLQYSPGVTSFLRGGSYYYWSERKSAHKIMNYFFLAGMIAYLMVMYIYIVTLCNGFRNEIKLSRLTYGNNNFSFKHIALSVTIFTLITTIIGFIISISMLPLFTDVVTKMYQLKDNIIPIYKVTFYSSMMFIGIMFLLWLISMVMAYVNIYFFQKRIFRKNI